MTTELIAATPAELLAAARRLRDCPDTAMRGRWPRASALLTRQALEQALDAYWRVRQPAVASSWAMQPKLLCLPTYLDEPLARRAHHAWVSLSNACHIGSYDLDPSADELDGWMNVVAEVISAVHAANTQRD